MSKKPLIALVHATPASMAPAKAALTEELPDATVWNLLDDRLLADADAAGGLTPDLRARMERLIDHALTEGADGVLLTCSMYGPVAHAMTSERPILASDDAAFRDVAEQEVGTVLVVASFAAALHDAEARLTEFLRERGSGSTVRGAVAEAAFAAALRGDTEQLLAALLDAVRPHADSVDAVLLAQYSLTPAAESLAKATGLPVFSGPQSAATTLRRLLTAG
ncbi:hypothetical protein ABZ863_22800 [Saccharomonospora sp. NPDC046836]|uniref:hypothetical protein n=1 Tax=Saccharomonospora sp. NPDC046836 TaxID=3156921 RepID=UPI0033C0F9F6